jgi:pimeloyl-ACP methyl ester carboxylesterase
MPDTKRGGFTLHYESRGPEDGHPLVLISGLGEQIGSVEFPDAQCDTFIAKGFRVIRMDNRDCGLSLPEREPAARDARAAFAGLAQGKMPEPDYLLTDFADDIAAVLDHAGIASAGIVGASLGGFIVRWFALRHPSRVRSLTVVMSGNGASAFDEGAAPPDAQAFARLLPMADREPRDKAIEDGVALWRWLWGDHFAIDSAWVQERVAFAYDRSYRPEGIGRALVAAICSTGLWTEQTKIACPTLVMHGTGDPVIGPIHAEQTAPRIPGAKLWMVPGMGHIMHEEHWAEMAGRVAAL